MKLYPSILAEADFRVVATYEDEGRNNYYEAERVSARGTELNP